jgi:F-type H+-transporting ATPase subunit b
MDIAKLLESLNIDKGLIGFNILGVIALLYVCNNLVFKPINKLLDERAGDINSTYDKLDADRAEMNSLKTDYEARLDAVEVEGREKIQTAVKEAQATRDQIVTDANTRAKDIVGKAEQEAERERREGIFLMRQQIVDLAMGATGKVLGSVDNTKHTQLIDDFISGGLGEAPKSLTQLQEAVDAPTKATKATKTAKAKDA